MLPNSSGSVLVPSAVLLSLNIENGCSLEHFKVTVLASSPADLGSGQ
jgi:hypothetical protein